MNRCFLGKFIFLFLIVLVLSCNDDIRGSLYSGDAIPSPVTEISVTNLPGGAKVEYKVPHDKEALYIEATYTLDNGKHVSTKSSIFKNYIIVEGLRQTHMQEVQLTTFNRFGNHSDPVVVTIHPEKAPIDNLFSTFEMVEDFGGIRLNYQNDDNLSVEILLYSENENGDLVYNHSVFINDNKRNYHSFRGFASQQAKFGVSIIDRWDNTTDILEAELTPLKETKLDREKFRELLLEGDMPGGTAGWIMPYLFDGSIDEPGFHTNHIEPGKIIYPYTENYHAFTMDLGVVAKLSRFKFWQRQRADLDGLYSHGNPRYFELWGIDKIPDNDGSLEGWTKLVENGEVIKPSGASPGTNSAEDIASAADGEEFDINIDAPPVRYIRFVNKQNWAGTTFMFLMEVSFWGEISE